MQKVNFYYTLFFFFFFHTNVNININFNVDKIIRRLGSIAGGNKHTTGGQCYG